MPVPSEKESLVCYAHSRAGRPLSEWESLAQHATEVGTRAGDFAVAFGWAGAAKAAGLLHDAGKCSAEFQAYIRAAGAGSPTSHAKVDHSTKGAKLARELYGGDFLGRMLALCVAGHHAGLADAEELDRRLEAPTPEAKTWRAHITPPAKAELRNTRPFLKPQLKYEEAFSRFLLVRMLFSCLTDADFLATEEFMSEGTIRRGIAVPLELLQENLKRYLEEMERNAPRSRLNALRREIREHALGKAGETSGFFTLTVPTGGGKTLISLDFALEHARRKGKRRVIYVIPFTSIIEQTAVEFRRALGMPQAVIEHHSNFDWEEVKRAASDGGDEQDGLGVLRRAAENWDAPVVVTTTVQFFESLFASRTSSCRKLHNIADAVIVLDEAQMLPIPLLLPCLAVLRELTRNYGVAAVLCTATQPALRVQDCTLIDGSGENFGLDIPDARELAPDPPALYRELRRTRVEVLAGKTDDEVIADRFAEVPRMMCIVNTRRHARELFDRVGDLPGAVHLSTLMCPADRSKVLAALRTRLKETDEPVRLVATSLIEAGVDIDFPEVWRAACGVDSIAQAAGRCNREGRMPTLGRVVVFQPAEHKPPRSMVSPQQAAASVLRDFADPLSLEAVGAYFRQLYFQKGTEALDAIEINGYRGVLKTIQESAPRCRFPFRSIAEAFRLIDEAMCPIVVPWNDEAKVVLARIAHSELPASNDFRILQRYTVGIPKPARDRWLGDGIIRPVRPSLGEALLRFEDDSQYRPATGIDLSDPAFREAESNIF